MFHEIGSGRFDNQFKNVIPKEEDEVIVFAGDRKPKDKILLAYDEKTNTISFPTRKEFEGEFVYLCSLDGHPFFFLWDFTYNENSKVPDGYAFYPISILRRSLPQDLSFVAMTAYHLYEWYRGSQFCGKCGTKNIHDEKERMMKCPSCGQMHFPKICPAVIVAVRNGNSIMMSRYAGREYKGRALLAGFCEIGESAEETVVREVLEEVGVHVNNVTYFGSQPWGFDSDLLLGYYCDVVGDTTVSIDEEELAIAEWVEREDIEPDTNLRSLTATMIDAFRTGKI